MSKQTFHWVFSVHKKKKKQLHSLHTKDFLNLYSHAFLQFTITSTIILSFQTYIDNNKPDCSTYVKLKHMKWNATAYIELVR